MITVTSPSNFSISIAAAAFVFCVGGIGAATAQSMPDKENGRYALAPVADGVLKPKWMDGVSDEEVTMFGTSVKETRAFAMQALQRRLKVIGLQPVG